MSLKLDDIHCYYLCKHFYDTFKNRTNDNENSVGFLMRQMRWIFLVIVAKFFLGSYFSFLNVTGLYNLTS